MSFSTHSQLNNFTNNRASTNTFDLINFLFLNLFVNETIQFIDANRNWISLNTQKNDQMFNSLADVCYIRFFLFQPPYECYSHKIVDGSQGNFMWNRSLFSNVCKIFFFPFLRWKRQLIPHIFLGIAYLASH